MLKPPISRVDATIRSIVVSVLKKDMVPRFLHWIFLLALFFCLYSCKKGNPTPNSQIIGTWTWVETLEGNNILVDRSSGIEKRLIFSANDMLSITHNDSTGNDVVLLVLSPYVIKPDSVTNIATYQLTSQPAFPCDPDKLPFLVIQNFGSYQYEVVGDSLMISVSPCLAPVISIYVKNS
jgi:hypothetical protein